MRLSLAGVLVLVPMLALAQTPSAGSSAKQRNRSYKAG